MRNFRTPVPLKSLTYVYFFPPNISSITLVQSTPGSCPAKIGFNHSVLLFVRVVLPVSTQASLIATTNPFPQPAHVRLRKDVWAVKFIATRSCDDDKYGALVLFLGILLMSLEDAFEVFPKQLHAKTQTG
jgi:hypothetical protein